MPHPHLTRAPILEARIDLQVDGGLVVPSEAFDAVAASSFPERKQLVQMSSNIDATSSQTPVLTEGPTTLWGHAFWSVNKQRVLQARFDGFAFSHLQPYDRWSALREDAREWWGKYAAIAKPRSVTRCSLRYITRLVLPLPMNDLGDYLRTRPELPEELKMASGLFMRLAIPLPPATVIITQAIDDAGVTSQSIPIILDIEVSRAGPFAVDSEEPWGVLDDLRRIKSEVFFQSVTRAAWEQYL